MYDWPIDAKVLVWDWNSKTREVKKIRAHFAGVDLNGQAKAWNNGRTSFTKTYNDDWFSWDNAELVED